MTDDDFERLATDLATLPPADRVPHMIDHIRHELDKARSDGVWDKVTSLSQMLGGHAVALAEAIGGQGNGKAVVEKPKRAA